MNALPGDHQVAEGKRPRDTEAPGFYAKHAKGQRLNPLGRAFVAYANEVAQRERQQQIAILYAKYHGFIQDIE